MAARVADYYGVLTYNTQHQSYFEIDMPDLQWEHRELVSIEVETPLGHVAFIGLAQIERIDGMTRLVTFRFEFDELVDLSGC